MTNKDLYYVSRAETISEIAMRNAFPISRVREIYNNFTIKHYSKNLRDIGKSNPDLYKHLFEATEKYIGIQRIKNLNKLKCELEKSN